MGITPSLKQMIFYFIDHERKGLFLNRHNNTELFIINLISFSVCSGIGERSLKILDITNKDNLVFKPWHVVAIRAIEEAGESPIGTKGVWEYVNTQSHERISRAAVTLFLQDLRTHNLVQDWEQHGQGGKRFAYVLPLDRAFFDSQALMIVLDKLVREFPEADHMAAMRLVKEHIEAKY